MQLERILRSVREPKTIQLFSTFLLLTWLVWPLLLTPLMMDEVYGVVGIMGITPNSSLFDVLINPFRSDVYNFYLYDSGRITPIGVIMYQGGYWLVSNVALSTGIHVATIYAFAKLFLLILIALSLRSLIRQFLKSEERDSLATFLTLVAMTVFVVGLRTDMATRNGLTVYSFLTYTAALFTFLVPALLLKTLRKFRSPVPFYAVCVVSATLLGLSYELHYLAIVMSFLVLLFAPIEKSKVSASRFGAAILATLSLAIQFRIRFLVSDACNDSECYTGTSIVIDKNLPSYFLNNIRGNLPSRGGQILEQARKDNFSLELSLAQYFVTLVVLLLLFRLLFSLGSQFKELLREEIELLPLRKLSYASFFVAGIAIFLTSLSSAAQEVLKNPVPYRGYVLIWTLVSVGAVLLLFSIAYRITSRRNAAIAAGFIVVVFGVYSLPYQQQGVSIISSNVNNKAFYDLHEEFFDPASAVSPSEYCKLVVDIGDSRRAQALRKNLNNVFEDLTGSKFCDTLPKVDEIDMPFIDR